MNFASLAKRLPAALCLLAAIATAPAWAVFPDHPIRLLQGYAPGAGGNIAMEMVAKAKPDGYTIMLATSPNITINPHLYRNLPFDPLKDLVPISMIHTGQNLLVVHPSLPVNNLAELVAYAKANPGKLTYGTSGAGSYQHLSGELFERFIGTKLVHVPYRGGAAARTDFLGGQISLMFTDVSSVPFVKEGKMRAIAWNGSKRNPLLPDLPTMAEAGMPEFNIEGYTLLVAPAHTPPEVLQTLNRSVAKALTSPAIQKKLVELGYELVENTSPEFVDARDRAESKRWGAIIKAANIHLD
jgi:tripartite-type tricarboxylate transporter receptor subunit TctC